MGERDLSGDREGRVGSRSERMISWTSGTRLGSVTSSETVVDSV